MSLDIKQVRTEAERLPYEFQEQIESLINVWDATEAIEYELRDVFFYTPAIAVIPGGNPIVNELVSAHQHMIKAKTLCEELNKQIIEKGALQNKKQEGAIALRAAVVEHMNIVREKPDALRAAVVEHMNIVREKPDALRAAVVRHMNIVREKPDALRAAVVEYINIYGGRSDEC